MQGYLSLCLYFPPEVFVFPLQVETPGGYSIPGVISEGIAGFVDTVVWLFIAILTLLPVLILAGAGYWVYQRRVKNRQG